ncbi:MAG: CBS domain-containing protein [Sedimenticola sp.]
MQLNEILIPSGVVTDGMKVRDAFRLCLEANVPAVPYIDSSGRPAGFISYDGVMHRGCLPNYIVDMATILGNQLSCVNDAEAKIREVLDSPATEYINTPLRTLSSDSLLIKGLAILEKFSSSYLFVFDGEVYRGVVTSQAIARHMLQIDGEN